LSDENLTKNRYEVI